MQRLIIKRDNRTPAALYRLLDWFLWRPVGDALGKVHGTGDQGHIVAAGFAYKGTHLLNIVRSCAAPYGGLMCP